jgi:hypothetical protein
MLGRTPYGTRSSPLPWTPGSRSGTYRKPLRALIRAPRCAERARGSPDRHATYIVAAYIAGRPVNRSASIPPGSQCRQEEQTHHQRPGSDHAQRPQYEREPPIWRESDRHIGCEICPCTECSARARCTPSLAVAAASHRVRLG